ncbi:hypothetical protein MMC22_002955 [Lobaria immixta]|nr:hypothetical protein [Lobaria immixta]
MALTLCYFVSVVLEALLLCRPVPYGWDKSIHGVCGNQQLGFLLTGIVNLIIDVFIVLLPMPMLWGLQMPLMKKVAISGIFGMGFALTTLSERICIISAFRIKSIADLDFKDFTYSLINDGIWSALEPFLGIVNACLPILQPVIAKVGKTSLFSRTRGSSKASNSKASSDQNSTKPFHSDESDTKNFHRLYNHVYPLEDNPVASNQNESSCFGSPPTPNETNSLKQITVTKNWNVHSTSTSAV